MFAGYVPAAGFILRWGGLVSLSCLFRRKCAHRIDPQYNFEIFCTVDSTKWKKKSIFTIRPVSWLLEKILWCSLIGRDWFLAIDRFIIVIDWSIIYSCDFGQSIGVQWERHCSCGKVLIKGSIWALFFERGLLKCFNSEREKKNIGTHSEKVWKCCSRR